MVEPLSPYRRARRFTYDLLLTPELETTLERWVRNLLTLLIVVNVLMVVLETVASVEVVLAGAFDVVEVVSVAIFAVEYAARLWAAVEDPRYAHPLLGRLRFALSFFALVDLVAILPFFLPQLIRADLRFVRGLRLLRLARLFKLGRYSASVAMYARVFGDKREELVVSLALLGLLLLMASSAMYFLERGVQPQHFSSIPAAMWWGIVTLTTIGYGDVAPITPLGRFFGGIIAVVGVGFVALPSALLVSGMMELMAEKRRQRAAGDAPGSDAPRPCPHCGRRPDEPPDSSDNR